MSSYGLWLSAAGMKVNQHRQTILANNMANANTTGFKHDLAVVVQRRIERESAAGGFQYAHPVLDGMPGGLNVRQSYQNFAQGPIEHTSRPYDVAIDGEGFFTVSDGVETRYTRDGVFAVNAAQELVMAAGNGRWNVLDDAGSPIALAEGGGEFSVSEDGTVYQGGRTVAALELMTTENMQSLRKVGENLFKPDDDVEMIPASGRLESRAREGSNFNVMTGLASMIESSRAYKLNATMLQLHDHLAGMASSTVGKIP